MAQGIIRAVLGFFVGYIAMAIIIVAGFMLGPLALGVDRVFEPGKYEATALWMYIAVGIGLVGGIGGGLISVLVSRGRSAGYAIIVAVVLFSVAAVVQPAAPQSSGTDGAASTAPSTAPSSESASAFRSPDLTFMEVMENAQKHAHEPLFTRITNPIAGVVGVWIGMSLLSKRTRRSDAAHGQDSDNAA